MQFVNAEGRLHDTHSFDCHNNPVCGALGPLVKDRREVTAHLHCVSITPGGGVHAELQPGRGCAGVVPPGSRQTHSRGAGSHSCQGQDPGPRHVAFHPTKKWAYCIHELDCTVDLYDWSETSGVAEMKLRESSVISTLCQRHAACGQHCLRNFR